MIDKAAREMGIDPVEIRRRNFIQPDQYPYQTPVAVMYDSGNYGATLDKALELSDYAGFAARRAESEARGKLRGLGPVDLDRGLRHRALEPGRPARGPRWPLRERDRAGERHRLDLGHDRFAFATARATRPPSRR